MSLEQLLQQQAPLLVARAAEQEKLDWGWFCAAKPAMASTTTAAPKQHNSTALTNGHEAFMKLFMKFLFLRRT